MPRNLITSDLSIRTVKSGDPRKRLSDGDGLYLLLFVKGGAHGWRLDYTMASKRKTLSLGTFPDVGLAAARRKADEARALVADGIDPSDVRKEARRAERTPPVEASTFKAVALAWLDHQAARWGATQRKTILASLENDVFGALGSKPMASLKARDVLDVILKIEKRGAGDMAGRVLQRVKSVFRFAIVTGLIDTNPTLDLKPMELLKPRRVRHRAALPEAELPEFLSSLSAYDGNSTTAMAIRFMMLTTARPGEVRGAEWAEITGNLWRIPAERMKMSAEHVIPLSTQALAVLEEMKPHSSMDTLVFPSPYYPGKSLSENTMNSALARMGYKGIATAHGFRALFSTVANESGWDGDVIERQLAHVQQNQTRAAYHRSTYMAERAKLVQWWADFIDSKREPKSHQSKP